MIETNLVKEAIDRHPRKATGLCSMINEDLGTRYRETDLYAWRNPNSKKKPPATVQRVLRRFVIEDELPKSLGARLLQMIEPILK